MQIEIGECNLEFHNIILLLINTCERVDKEQAGENSEKESFGS